MRTLQIRSLSLPALALLVFAGSATAQDKSPVLLNTLEVQQLVKRADTGDNARLAAHFAALADRYVAEAKQHTTMANAYTGNAGRSLATGMSVHCKQLADLNTQSAKEVRELAAYHQKLASGAAGTPPAAGSRFEGGAGAPAPTKQDLNALAARASTPADHHALEEVLPDVGEAVHEGRHRLHHDGEHVPRHQDGLGGRAWRQFGQTVE